jgi:hypothetical protein
MKTAVRHPVYSGLCIVGDATLTVEKAKALGYAIAEPRPGAPAPRVSLRTEAHAEVTAADHADAAARAADFDRIAAAFADFVSDRPRSLAERAAHSDLLAAVRRAGYDAPPDAHSPAGQILSAAAKRDAGTDATAPPLPDPKSMAGRILAAGRRRRGEEV